MCEQCKMNAIMSKMVNHHGSRELIYSFGNQGIVKKLKNSMGVCVNASTADYHTENDASYTLIA